MNKAALLIIDVQKGLFRRKNWVYNEDILLGNINMLIEKSRDRSIPVIFIRHTNTSFLQENSDSWQIHPTLRAKVDDYYFNKEHSSIFDEKNIVDKLREMSLQTLIVTGLVTHGCVKAACIGGIQAGYDVVLVSDGHSSFNENAKKLIDDWNGKLSEEGVQVIAAKDVFV
ncbi:MAG: isochorismatase family protein [Pseudomonadota bacterium]